MLAYYWDINCAVIIYIDLLKGKLSWPAYCDHKNVIVYAISVKIQPKTPVSERPFSFSKSEAWKGIYTVYFGH